MRFFSRASIFLTVSASMLACKGRSGSTLESEESPAMHNPDSGSNEGALAPLVGSGEISGERYESLETLHCSNGASVNLPFYQVTADQNGSAGRLGRAKSDAPFVWILKTPDTKKIKIGFYANVGGTYTVDSTHSTAYPFSTGRFNLGYLALYDVSGTMDQLKLSQAGYIGIPTQGLCRFDLSAYYSPVIEELSADAILSNGDLPHEKALEARNNSWVNVPPKNPGVKFLDLQSGSAPQFSLEFADVCGQGVPLRIKFVLSGDRLDDDIRACHEIPKRLEIR